MKLKIITFRVRVMVLNPTFKNISVILWWSVLLVEDPEKTTDLSQVTDKLSHNVVSSTPHMNGVFFSS
jgi:hypothetical protein